MASGKRASMREGPLAALFRKTDEDGPEAAEGRPDVAGLDAPSREPRSTVAPAQTPVDAAPVAPPAPVEPAPVAPPVPVAQPAPVEPAPVNPPSPFDLDEPIASVVPSPRERLRHAFSPELRHAHEEPIRHTPKPGQAVLRVVGVGGAGVNAVNRMVEAEVEGVEFLAVNTDAQSLQGSDAHVKVHIGEQLTRGLGAGANPDLGRQAAMEDYDKIKALLKGSDMIFITAGAGGGTGTGAAPMVARIAREIGALTVGIVTKPFGFEGSKRGQQADDGIATLADEVDTLIVVPNNRLLSVLDKQTSMVDAFRVADDVLRQGVQGISDLVTLPGLINLDFADVRTIMAQAGAALLGIGMGTGDRRAIDAAEKAVASPLLETSMDGARSILLSITGGRDLSLWEVNEAAKAVAEAAHPDANIIFGAMVDEKLEDQVWVTVVATSYGDAARPQRRGEAPGLDLGREPTGEPTVRRAREREPVAAAPRRRSASDAAELDIPEFLPRR
jgi:cell division protein FtsZ